jgi:hypothetical protein
VAGNRIIEDFFQEIVRIKIRIDGILIIKITQVGVEIIKGKIKDNNLHFLIIIKEDLFFRILIKIIKLRIRIQEVFFKIKIKEIKVVFSITTIIRIKTTLVHFFRIINKIHCRTNGTSRDLSSIIIQIIINHFLITINRKIINKQVSLEIKIIKTIKLVVSLIIKTKDHFLIIKIIKVLFLITIKIIRDLFLTIIKILKDHFLTIIKKDFFRIIINKIKDFFNTKINIQINSINMI